MPGFNANEFRQELTFGGARSTLFRVTLTFPSFVPGASAAGSKFSFMCKGSQLPGMNLGMTEVNYFGRPVKIPGDRVFEDWNVTIINDEDFLVRNALEAWQNGVDQIDHDTGRLRASGAEGINTIVADITVQQLSKAGSVVKQYQLKNAWPLVIEPIDVNWDNRDQIEEFGATFAYDYFVTQSAGPEGTIGKGTFPEGSNTPF